MSNWHAVRGLWSMSEVLDRARVSLGYTPTEVYVASDNDVRRYERTGMLHGVEVLRVPDDAPFVAEPGTFYFTRQDIAPDRPAIERPGDV